MKTKEEIRATTTERIPRPADYEYGKKLVEWDASLPPNSKDLLLRTEPFADRIIVKLIDEPAHGSVVLTDKQPLIGGMRKAVVLKCGPGKWMPRGWRRPMAVKPGQTVYIGNWVDLEAGGLALCQEGDVRGYVEEKQRAQNGSHRKAQISKGRRKCGAGRRARISHVAKTL